MTSIVPAIEFFDPGTAPEYFITHCRVEAITDSDCLRLYACVCRTQGEMILQYTAVVPKHRMVAMLKEIELSCACSGTVN